MSLGSITVFSILSLSVFPLISLASDSKISGKCISFMGESKPLEDMGLKTEPIESSINKRLFMDELYRNEIDPSDFDFYARNFTVYADQELKISEFPNFLRDGVYSVSWHRRGFRHCLHIETARDGMPVESSYTVWTTVEMETYWGSRIPGVPARTNDHEGSLQFKKEIERESMVNEKLREIMEGVFF